jgi:hypothetical protein
MKQKIHDICTGIKFLYPCIAYEDGLSETELIITAETKLSSIYPIRLKVDGMDFLGDDFWGRPSFKNEQNQFFCELDGLLYFKGNSIDGEPHYPVNKSIHFILPDIDKDFQEFQHCVAKVRQFAIDHGLNLINVDIQKKINDKNILNSQIICKYTFSLQ